MILARGPSLVPYFNHWLGSSPAVTVQWLQLRNCKELLDISMDVGCRQTDKSFTVLIICFFYSFVRRGPGI